MTGPTADAERKTLSGGDAVSRAVQASDGVELHYLRWCSGRSPPWAVVVFLHGIASHGGWFAETAADLDSHGVAVYAPDRRGSGRSGGPRGHLNRYERALDDVDEIMGLVSAEHPGTPVFLAASSWAAKLGVVYAARRPAPAIPWTSSQIAAGTWPSWSAAVGPGPVGVLPVDGRWSLDADGDRAAAVRGRPSLQGLLPARRRRADQLRACSCGSGWTAAPRDGGSRSRGPTSPARAALGDQNSEYQTKRKSLRYGAPVIRVVRPGEFDRYRRRLVEQGHRTDGQFKVLRLTSDASFAAEFEADRDLISTATTPQEAP